MIRRPPEDIGRAILEVAFWVLVAAVVLKLAVVIWREALPA